MSNTSALIASLTGRRRSASLAVLVLMVLAAFNLAVGLRVGLDLIGDEFFNDDAFEAIGIFDDEPRLDHAGKVNFSEADFRAAHGRWIG